MRHEENQDVPCSISRSLAILGDRWTFLVIKQAFGGVRRFEDFRASLDISRSRLADRLDRLVETASSRVCPTSTAAHAWSTG